jgi:hypothetical protein
VPNALVIGRQPTAAREKEMAYHDSFNLGWIDIFAAADNDALRHFKHLQIPLNRIWPRIRITRLNSHDPEMAKNYFKKVCADGLREARGWLLVPFSSAAQRCCAA